MLGVTAEGGGGARAPVPPAESAPVRKDISIWKITLKFWVS